MYFALALQGRPDGVLKRSSVRGLLRNDFGQVVPR